MRKLLCILMAFVICLSVIPCTAGCNDGGKIEITYNGNGGYTVVDGKEESSVIKTVKLGSNFVAPKFYREGYTLIGWDKKVNDVTADTEMNAIWQQIAQKEYTVTLDLNGGKLVNEGDLAKLSQTVDAGEDIKDFPKVKREGYEFQGWSASGENITASVTIRALWKAEKRYVVFSANGGYFVDESEGTIVTVTKQVANELGEIEDIEEQFMIVEVDYGKAAVPPVIKKDGYYIVGYDSDNNGEIDADFGKITVGVDIDELKDNDGNIDIEKFAEYVDSFNGTVENNESPIKVVWAENVVVPDNTEETGESTTDNKNQNKRLKYTVSFKSLTGHYGLEDDITWKEQSVYYNQNATLITLSSTPYPYRLKAWLGDYKNVRQDRTLYALWEEITFTMSFDLDGGTLDTDTTKTDNATNVNDNAVAGLTQYSGASEVPGKISAIPVPVKKGYKFAGWEGKNAYGSSYSETEVTDVLDDKTPAKESVNDEYYRWISSVSFVAQWEVDESNPIEFTVTFDGNGGTTEGDEDLEIAAGKETYTITYAIDEEIEPISFLKEDSELLAWSMALEDVKEHCLATGVYEITVTAEWREIWNSTTNVTLDANGGDLDERMQTMTFNQGVKISGLPTTLEKQAVKEGEVCLFRYWYYEKAVNGIVKQFEVKNGKTWSENFSSVVLHAMWYEGVPETKVTFNIHGNMDGLGGEIGYDYITNVTDFYDANGSLKVFTFKALGEVTLRLPDLKTPAAEEGAEKYPDYEFDYWYYIDENGEQVKVSDGDIWDKNIAELELLPKWKGPVQSGGDGGNSGGFQGDTESSQN